MAEPPHKTDVAYPELRDDQMLAIAIYGETVAAYRYLVLAEKLPEAADRALFAGISDEEQGHKQRLQALQDKYFPSSSFYLSDQDKALVVTGPRLVNVRDLSDYREVVEMALDTEYRVSRFYQAMSKRMSIPEVRTLFVELASESAGHHLRLVGLARQRGLLRGSQPDSTSPPPT